MGRKAAVSLAQRLGVDRGQPSADAAASADTGDRGTGSLFPSHNTAQTHNRIDTQQTTGHLSSGPKARTLSIILAMHRYLLPEHACECVHIHTHHSTRTYKRARILAFSTQDSDVKAHHTHYHPRPAPCAGAGRQVGRQASMLILSLSCSLLGASTLRVSCAESATGLRELLWSLHTRPIPYSAPSPTSSSHSQVNVLLHSQRGWVERETQTPGSSSCCTLLGSQIQPRT